MQNVVSNMLGVTFYWDAENRLVGFGPSATPRVDDQRAAYVYDYQGRRVEKLVEICTAAAAPAEAWAIVERTRFVHDGWNVIEQMQVAGNDEIVAVTRRYTWGLDLAGLSGAGAGSFQGMGGTGVSPVASLHAAGGIGGLLAVHDETVESGEDYIYFYDANGNVGQLVAFEDDYGDATDDDWHADRLVARYEYDAYGRITGPDTNADGDWRDDAGPYASTNVMRFSTKPWDDEIGWGNWGERLYEPRIGRWVNRDPIGELSARNLYVFVLNRPVRLIDPDGKDVWIENTGAAMGWHERVCVTLRGDNCEIVGKFCVGFGAQGKGSSDSDSSQHPIAGHEGPSPGGGIGVVFDDNERPSEGGREANLSTSCEADREILQYLKSLIGNRGGYCVVPQNCRWFASNTWDYIRDRWVLPPCPEGQERCKCLGANNRCMTSSTCEACFCSGIGFAPSLGGGL